MSNKIAIKKLYKIAKAQQAMIKKIAGSSNDDFEEMLRKELGLEEDAEFKELANVPLEPEAEGEDRCRSSHEGHTCYLERAHIGSHYNPSAGYWEEKRDERDPKFNPYEWLYHREGK